MKILAFAATSSSTSINAQLVKYAASKLDGHEIEFLDINDYEMPLFSEDREAEVGQHERALAFHDKITASDALLISYAEHNGSYTAAWKNLFDWTSRIDPKVFQEKKAIYLATSPGPAGASNVLNQAVTSAPFFGAELLDSLSIPSFYDNFDADAGRLKGDDIDTELDAVLNHFELEAYA